MSKSYLGEGGWEGAEGGCCVRKKTQKEFSMHLRSYV